MFKTTTTNPFPLFTENPELKSVQGLTTAQFGKLRKLWLENNKDELITTVVSNLDEKEQKLFSKQFLTPVKQELTSFIAKLDAKWFGKRINYDAICQKIEQQLKINPSSVHFKFDSQHQIPALFSIIYQYLSTTIPDVFQTVLEQQQPTTSSTEMSDSTATEEQKQPKLLPKLQQLVSSLVLLISIKDFTSQFVWDSKVAKSISVSKYDNDVIQSALDLLPDSVQQQQPQQTGRRGKKQEPIKKLTKTEQYPVFTMLFDNNDLNNTSNWIIAQASVEQQSKELVMNLQRQYRRVMNPDNVEKDNSKEGKLQQKLDKKQEKLEKEQAKSQDTSMSNGDQNSAKDDKKVQNSSKLDAAGANDEKTAKTRILYVEANHVWEPSYEDQLYAISQLRPGQVRFGVVQGVEDKLGVFVDTWQNHVKIRCLVGFGNLYDHKTMRNKIDKHGGLVEEEDKSTKKMERFLGIVEEKNVKKDDQSDKTSKKGQREFKSKRDQDKHDPKAFKPELVMKFARKQYQVGDRVSFIVTSIQQPEKDQKINKNGRKGAPQVPSAPKLPKVYISFTNWHFSKLARKYAYTNCVAFKYLLYLKFIEIRNKLLYSRAIDFYPPRFIDQVLKTPALAQFSSEFVSLDSKFLAMQLDLVDPNYASNWFKINKLTIPKTLKPAQIDENDENSMKTAMNDESDEEEQDDENVKTNGDEDMSIYSKLTGEFGQYSDDEADNSSDSDSGEDESNPQLQLIKQHLRSDPVLNKWFSPSIGKIKQYQNILNSEDIGTLFSSQVHSHNKYGAKHYHVSPGLNSATFAAVTKEQKIRQQMTDYSKEQLGQIYLQSNAFVRLLMSFQPFPETSKFRLNEKSLQFHYVNEFDREKQVSTFFCDHEHFQFMTYHGEKHVKYIKRLNKIKSKSLRAIVAGLDLIKQQQSTTSGKKSNNPELTKGGLDSGDNNYNFQQLDLIDSVSALFELDPGAKQRDEAKKKAVEKAQVKKQEAVAEKAQKTQKTPKQSESTEKQEMVEKAQEKVAPDAKKQPKAREAKAQQPKQQVPPSKSLPEIKQVVKKALTEKPEQVEQSTAMSDEQPVDSVTKPKKRKQIKAEAAALAAQGTIPNPIQTQPAAKPTQKVDNVKQEIEKTVSNVKKTEKTVKNVEQTQDQQFSAIGDVVSMTDEQQQTPGKKVQRRKSKNVLSIEEPASTSAASTTVASTTSSTTPALVKQTPAKQTPVKNEQITLSQPPSTTIGATMAQKPAQVSEPKVSPEESVSQVELLERKLKEMEAMLARVRNGEKIENIEKVEKVEKVVKNDKIVETPVITVVEASNDVEAVTQPKKRRRNNKGEAADQTIEKVELVEKIDKTPSKPTKQAPLLTPASFTAMTDQVISLTTTTTPAKGKGAKNQQKVDKMDDLTVVQLPPPQPAPTPTKPTPATPKAKQTTTNQPKATNNKTTTPTIAPVPKSNTMNDNDDDLFDESAKSVKTEATPAKTQKVVGKVGKAATTPAKSTQPIPTVQPTTPVPAGTTPTKATKRKLVVVEEKPTVEPKMDEKVVERVDKSKPAAKSTPAKATIKQERPTTPARPFFDDEAQPVVKNEKITLKSKAEQVTAEPKPVPVVEKVVEKAAEPKKQQRTTKVEQKSIVEQKVALELQKPTTPSKPIQQSKVTKPAAEAKSKATPAKSTKVVEDIEKNVEKSTKSTSTASTPAKPTKQAQAVASVASTVKSSILSTFC
jgi:hypothetical protein